MLRRFLKAIGYIALGVAIGLVLIYVCSLLKFVHDTW